MLKDEYKIYEEKMKKSIESVNSDFAAVRAGRANAAVLNRISVDYYGTPKGALTARTGTRSFSSMPGTPKWGLCAVISSPESETTAPTGPI